MDKKYDEQYNEQYNQEIRIRIPRDIWDHNYTPDEVSGVLLSKEREYYCRSDENVIYKNTLNNYLTLPPEEMGKIAYGYLVMCETIASDLYFSMVLNNGYLKYLQSIITDDENTIQKTFDKGFINMLKSLLNSRWRSDGNGEQNQILINGTNVDNGECFEKLKDTPKFLQKISIEKPYLNLFFTLFMKNSLDLMSHGGYLSGSKKKIISIEIEMNTIRITDIPINYEKTEDYKGSCQKDFQEKNILSRELDFKYKTIRAFSGLIENMNVYGDDYKLDCGFNEDGNFFLELNFIINENKRVKICY